MTLGDPAWELASISIGDCLCILAVTMVLIVLVVTVVEHSGARAGERGRAVSRQRRLPLVSGLDPGPGATSGVGRGGGHVRLNRPGHERPWDWGGPEGGTT